MKQSVEPIVRALEPAESHGSPPKPAADGVLASRGGNVGALFASVRRHSRRATWAAVDQGINPLLQLALTPYFIARLGRREFGLWVLGITVVNMSQVISLGAGMAATKHVSADLGVGATARAVAAVRASLAVVLACGIGAATVLCLFAPLIAARFFAALGPATLVAPILALAVVAGVVQEIDGVYSGALRGAERFDLSARVEVPTRIGIGLVLVYLAMRYANAATMLEGLILAMSMKAMLKGRQAALLLGDGRCCLPARSMLAIKRVFRFGVWQWLQALGSVMFTSLDQLLVGGLLGSRALMRYSVCLQLAQYVHTIPSAAMQVIFPRVSSLGGGLGDRSRRSMLRQATVVAVGLAAFLGLALAVFSHPLLAHWIGPTFAAENSWLLVLLVLVHIVLAFNVGAYFILLGRGESKRSAKIVLSASVAQSLIAVVLAPFGIFAFACNRLVYALGTTFLYKAARSNTDGE